MLTKIINTYRAAYSDLPPQIWMLSAALFVNRFGTMVLPFLTLYLTKSQGYSNAAAGWMISIWGLGSVIGTYIGGRLISRVGAVRLQILLLLASVPLFLLLPFCVTYFQLSVAIFFLSMANEGLRPASATAISQFSTPEQRTRAFALQRMALNLGISFGPAIGGILIKYATFFWVFVADALTTLLCALVLGLFFGFKKRTKQETEEPVATSPDTFTKTPASDFEFILFLGLLLICSVVFFQFHATYPLYLNDHYQMDELAIGLIFAVNTVMVVMFEMVLVEYARRWKILVTIGWGCFLTCIGFGMLPFSSAVWFCVASMIVLTVGEMLSMPLSTSWVSSRSEGGDTGVYMGWYAMTYSIACIIGPAVGGMIYEFNKELVFYLSIVVAIVVLAGFYLLEKLIKARKNREW